MNRWRMAEKHFLTHALQGWPLLLQVDSHSPHCDPKPLVALRNIQSLYLSTPTCKEQDTATRCELHWPSQTTLDASVPWLLPVTFRKSDSQVQFSMPFSTAWLRAAAQEISVQASARMKWFLSIQVSILPLMTSRPTESASIKLQAGNKAEQAYFRN